MAIVLRWPFSDQMEVLSEKGVSIMGSSMESLVGALARGCSGGRCAVAALPLRGSALALRLAEGSRGLYRAQPVIPRLYINNSLLTKSTALTKRLLLPATRL